ncbi:MAG TPA: hypothetical protein VIE12_10450 [Actinomycetota bacterium]
MRHGRRDPMPIHAIVCATVALAACTSGDPASSQDVASSPGSPGEVHASAQTDPASGRLLIARYSGDIADIVTTATDGSDERPFAPGSSFEVRQLSPDGSVIAIVAASEEGPLVGGTIRPDGTHLALFPAAGRHLNLACGVWAPDGGLACEGWDDRSSVRSGVFLVDPDGRHPRRLTSARDIPCDYAPDGSLLAFVRTDRMSEVGTLMVMDAGGGEPRPLIGGVALSGLPCDWSPDGRSILVGSAAGSLRLVSLDGSSEPISGDGIDGFASGPTWSADGSRILFTMTLEVDQPDVYTVAADGSDLVRVTSGDTYDEGWLWLP